MFGSCLHVKMRGDPCLDQPQERLCSAGVSRDNDSGTELISSMADWPGKLHFKIANLENGGGKTIEPKRGTECRTC